MKVDDLRIVVVGAGNLATNMALAMRDAGLSVVQIYSRSGQSASRLAGEVGCPWTCAVDEIAGADLYVISVVDSAVATLARQLAVRHPGAVFCHTAGSVPIDVFAGLGIADYGVIYPLQTFSKARRVDFSVIPVFIEHSSVRAREVMWAVAGRLSGKLYAADSAVRGKLHLAAVFACNFTNRMYALAERILASGDLPFEVMLPLIGETLDKVRAMSPAAAQTGPAARGDMGVIDRHLALLAGDEELHDIYEMMTKSIMNGSNKL